MYISESEKRHILKLYNLLIEDTRPLQKLRECKISSDGRYIVYDNQVYLTSTGELAPISEAWSLSDILHTGADLVSMGMDFVIPGSGAVIDVLNALSYIIEAQFVDPEKKDSLYIMAAITFGFVILPGPLQAVAVPLKRAVKTGVGLASKTVVAGLKIIGKSLDVLLVKIPEYIGQALKSKMGKRLLGKWGDRLSGFISGFTSRIKTILRSIGSAPTATRAGTQTATRKLLQTLSKAQPQFLKNFMSKLPKINKGKMVLRKLGFAQGRSYRYVGKSGKASTATIVGITDSTVRISFKTGSKVAESTVPINTFISRAVGAPWIRRGAGVTVPFFIKRFADCLTSDGSVDEAALEKLSDINPDVTSEESLNYLREEVASYEGETGQYTENENAQLFQEALKKLEYDLGNFGPNKDGIDGKFGPKTKSALEKFQTKNGLEDSLGKMDRITANTLADRLPDDDETAIKLRKLVYPD